MQQEEKMSLIKKIRELAMRGVDGEKEAAQAALEKLSKKYGISLDEIEALDEEKTQEFRFEYHGKEEERLLHQVAFKVIGETGHCYDLVYTRSQRLCKTRLLIECTEAQKIEIEFLFNFYNQLWKKEKDFLYKAFVHKHGIFGKTAIDGSGRADGKEVEKIAAMMAGLSDETPLLQLEG